MKLSKYALLGSAIAFLALGATSSCTNDSSSSVADSIQQQYLKKLPREANATIKKLNTNIDTVLFSDNDEIAVILDNGIEVCFDAEGEWDKISMHKNEMTNEIMSLLPPKTQAYLKENTQGKTIKRLDRSRRRRLTVTLSGKEELHFARNGKYMPNDVKKLPSQVTTVLNKYFADDAITTATIDQNFEYSVDLQSGIYLEFDRMGHFERVEMPKGQTIPANFASFFPSLMMKYMSKNYPNRLIHRIIRKDYGYMVKTEKIKNEKPEVVELCFSKKGDYLRLANKGEENEEFKE